MDNPDSMMHALALAERNHYARRAGALQNQYADLTYVLANARASSWAWSARAKALEALILVIMAKYPNDPLFRKTGKKRPNGKPETVAHLEYDRQVLHELQKAPAPNKFAAIAGHKEGEKRRLF